MKAEDQKAMGIEAFKNRRYEEAIDFFTKTIQILQELPEKLQISENDKWRELLASCENNIAACYAAMVCYITATKLHIFTAHIIAE